MRKIIPFFLILFFVSVLTYVYFCYAKVEKDTDYDGLSDYEEQYVFSSSPTSTDTDSDGYQDGVEVLNGYSPIKDNNIKLTQLTLAVPYISEAPDDQWYGPWKNACEEASFAMVENYYLGNRNVSIWEAKNYMQRLFSFQDQTYGSNADADSWRSVYIITKQTHFRARVVENPSIDDIKKELQQKHPVITLHHGFSLQNKNIPFLTTGSSFHMMVVTGYDDTTQEFITNDPGDRVVGKGHRYSYDLFMKTLHDFDFNKRQASGPSRVLFTYPKLAQTVNSSTVYYLQDNYRYPISTNTLKKYGWREEGVAMVDESWLAQFTVGKEIR